MRNNAAYLPENPIVYIIFPESIHNRASFAIFELKLEDTSARPNKIKTSFVLLCSRLYVSLYSNMARILSIDYGRKRTGIAVTDPLQIIANGLTTVASSQLIDFLTQYMQRESVERVVVGLPRQMNNQPSESMRYITPFVNRFKKLFPNVPIEFFDERFTSVLAHRAMIDGGLSKMARRNKELVDEISATIILRDYLESKKQ